MNKIMELADRYANSSYSDGLHDTTTSYTDVRKAELEAAVQAQADEIARLNERMLEADASIDRAEKAEREIERLTTQRKLFDAATKVPEPVNCDDCVYHYKDADSKPCNTCFHSGDFYSNFEPRNNIKGTTP